MERRASTPCESSFSRNLKNFWVDIVSLCTYGDWNITAALILSFLTDFIAIFVNFLEPLFTTNCIGYVESMSLYSIFSLYQFCLVVIISFLLVKCINLGPFQAQIIILWIHAFNIVLFPYLISAKVSCYSDIEIHRPLIYFKLYSLVVCPGDYNNCYIKYFNTLMTVMLISITVGFWHSIYYGFRSWRRLSTMPDRSRSSTPAVPPLMNEELSNVDEYDYRADESSMLSVQLNQNPEAPARAPISPGRPSKRLLARREKFRMQKNVASSSSGSKSTDS